MRLRLIAPVLPLIAMTAGVRAPFLRLRRDVDRESLQRLADEQAALRRVATLVAEGIPAAELFSAVTKEVAHVFSGVDPSLLASVIRFAPGPECVLVGASRPYELEPVGSRWAPKELYVSTRVLRTGRSARVDEADLDAAGGPDAEVLRLRGFLYQVGSPVIVEGRVWGAMTLNSGGALPPDTDERLEAFTELVATAIADAESRHAVSRLADEQAALRRVATLVAEGTAPTDLFAAVAVEVAAVVGVSSGSVSRFLPDGSSVVLASHNDPGFPVGSRWRPDEGTMNAAILAGAPARVDQKALAGPIAKASTISDVRSAVGVPIVVEGSVWGMIAVGRQHSDDPLPPQTESRLAAFTELIATAIANAESRDALARLAEEQAALRRVATLVARGAPSAEVFEAVANEVGRLLDTDTTIVGRFESDGTATAIGNWSSAPGGVPVGTRSELGGRNVLTMVAETGRPARLDGYDDASGEAADIARRFGWRSSIAAPIVVEDRLWGVMLVATQRPEPFPAGAEERLATFTDLIATAIGNAQAHDEVRRFADDQAGLGRVATLVAAGAPAEQVFRAVADEVSSLLGLERIELVRYDGETTGTVIASAGDHPFPAGTTWSLDDPSVMAAVARTGAVARIDDYGSLDGDIARVAHAAGFRSAIGAPITVEGRLWGVVIAISTDPEPIPEQAEARLGQFTELVSTAVANADARHELERVAAEQAALRRVATLVAESPESEELFSAVAREVAGVLDVRGVIVDRFEPDGSQITLGSAYDRELAGADDFLGVGVHLPLRPGTLAAAVLETQGAARVEDYAKLEGPMGDAARAAGVGSGCAAPIIVDGQLWGQMCVFAAPGTVLPAGTEHQLDDFIKLVATAIANYDARARLRALADEQAALRRVATLVALGAPPLEVFAAVAEEVGLLLGASRVFVTRYESGNDATLVAGWDPTGGDVPVGLRFEVGEGAASDLVRRTGRPARVDAYVPGSVAQKTAEIMRIESAVAAPINVEGRLWGLVLVGGTADAPPPPGTEQRLAGFAELVATAIANTESREALAELGAEQEALRRIATLVAQGLRPEEIFAAVTDEVAELFDAITAIQRFDHDGPAVVFVGVSKGVEVDIPIGTRWEFADGMVSADVFRTGRPVRLDGVDWESRTGPAAVAGGRLGLFSQIGSPIVVDGRLWGSISVNSREELPADAAERVEKFTGLVATAIANAEGKSELAASEARARGLADEQAALRRVATLVAAGAAPEELFAAVAREVAFVTSVEAVTVSRYGTDASFTVLASGNPAFPVAGRWELDGPSLAATIHDTGRAARFDSYEGLGGEVAAAARAVGARSAVGAPIVVHGRVWGYISVASSALELPAETERRLQDFTELIATAISNASTREELIGSRARLVTAGDEVRRKIERNLHDGTQQRLVSLGLALRATEANLPADRDDLRAELSAVVAGLGAAMEDLQEISRGIHPAILSRGGLGPALQALAHRSPIPVDLELTATARVDEPIEVAAYFVASEALANAAKHSQASRIDVSLGQQDGSLVLTIDDDGVGGADAGRGSGLVGLTDRVEALGGTIRVASRPGEGTQIRAELPLAG